ncbi:arylesterase [Thiohalocapsa sp. ML1]|uniref:arylesterase n=1 Tax=Thiohalocapsa sp. ML1 TaxID=1431688 RepID=UPI000732383B|nr:arylesterase [Thiohalocapsa sp. ML1]
MPVLVFAMLLAGPVGAAAPAPRLLVLGDSLSAAFGTALDQGWVSLLKARIAEAGLPHTVVNASISGDTTAGGLSRLPALLKEHRPAVVVIELGANDGLRGFPPKQIAAVLTALVEQSQQAGARVLLAGVRLPPNYGSGYAEQFQALYLEVAQATGAALVPRLLAGVSDRRELMQPDGLHPTAAAQPKMLDNVWPGLLPLLKATADAEG